MNKETSNSLKGMAAIVVLPNHFSMFSDSKLIHLLFDNTGQLAVAIFLFMSEYGLTVSYQTQGDKYLRNYFVNKILRIVIVFCGPVALLH